MYNQLLHSTILDQDIQRAFFKCRKWQLEDTLDPINCPYHYYCNSRYPGDYPSYVDKLVILLTTFLFVTTIIAMMVSMITRGNTRFGVLRRYILPSGPIFLPIVLVIMAKGNLINTVFPLTHTGPPILQLVRISALKFDSKSVSDIKYLFLEASTMSGILQASLYLDSIILPYYTGFDALVSSRLSGECLSCVCRQRVLAVGGMLVYRGWSVTTVLVVGFLTLRIFSRIAPEIDRRIKLVKIGLECLSWILMSVECLYLVITSPPERSWIRAVSYSAVFVLICLHFIGKVVDSVVFCYNRNRPETNRDCTDCTSVWVTKKP